MVTDILESCRRLRDIAVHGRDEFFANGVLQDAACYRLAVIGEALNNLSADFAAQHTSLQIPSKGHAQPIDSRILRHRCGGVVGHAHS